MKITSLRIQVLKNTGTKMKGVAAITLDGMIAVHDIKILQNNDVLFLAMPSKSVKPGTFKDIVHPINAPVREAVERIIFGGYTFCLEKGFEYAQFDCVEEFSEALTEQSFGDFGLTSTGGVAVSSSETAVAEEKEEEPEEKPEKRNAFLDWLRS